MSKNPQGIALNSVCRRGLAAALLVLSNVAVAQQVPATLRVSVVVPPRVTVATRSPDLLEVSALDVARGYVELGLPEEVVVRSNGDFRVMLEVRVPRGLFTGIRLSGDVDAELPGEGGTVALSWNASAAGGSQRLSWKYRFALDPALPAGRYGWPVQIAGLPLAATGH